LWKIWYQNNPIRSIKRRFSEDKKKAAKRNLAWSIIIEQYKKLIIDHCFYCNNKLCDPVIRAVGLDRLNCKIGYQESNVVSCCYVCNIIKHQHLSPEETKIAVNAIIKYREDNNTLSIRKQDTMDIVSNHNRN